LQFILQYLSVYLLTVFSFTYKGSILESHDQLQGENIKNFVQIKFSFELIERVYAILYDVLNLSQGNFVYDNSKVRSYFKLFLNSISKNRLIYRSYRKLIIIFNFHFKLNIDE